MWVWLNWDKHVLCLMLASSSISKIQGIGEASDYKQRTDVRERDITGKTWGLS